MIAVFAAVFNDAAPRFTRLKRHPKVAKRLSWHIRMAQNIVRLIDQLCLGKTANFNKRAVHIDNIALLIGFREDELALC